MEDLNYELNLVKYIKDPIILFDKIITNINIITNNLNIKVCKYYS